MLAGDWGVVDAADGLLLLSKTASEKSIPDAFYYFVHHRDGPVEAVGPFTFLDVDVAYCPLAREQAYHQLAGGTPLSGRDRTPRVELRTPDGESTTPVAN